MTKEAREAIGKNSILNCVNCGSRKSYTNPFSTCFECRKRFCFKCIWAGLKNPKMNQTDEWRDVCDKCKLEKRYT